MSFLHSLKGNIMLARKALMPLWVGIEGKIEQRKTSVSVIVGAHLLAPCSWLCHTPRCPTRGRHRRGRDKVVVRLPQGPAQAALQLAQWMRVGLTDVTICETYHKWHWSGPTHQLPLARSGRVPSGCAAKFVSVFQICNMDPTL